MGMGFGVERSNRGTTYAGDSYDWWLTRAALVYRKGTLRSECYAACLSNR